MSDWKHRTTEQARDALSRFCTRKPVMTIPVDNERDADMILGDVIEERDSLLLQVGELSSAVRALLAVKRCGSFEEAAAREKVKALLPPVTAKQVEDCPRCGPDTTCLSCASMDE